MSASQSPSIVGVMLLRNEEWSVLWALENIVGFCDRIYVFDHLSEDGTPELLESAGKTWGHVEVRRVENARESHQCLEPLAGTPAWVFAVGGDEIYDPEKRSGLRTRLRNGEFDSWFKLTGNCLHATRLDGAMNDAEGFSCPPSKAITKLYNFNAITRWDSVPNERLHGGEIDFRPGFSQESRLHFWKDESWDSTPLRCLHLCFLPRSSRDVGSPLGRPNISDKVAGRKKSTTFWNRVKSKFQTKAPGSPWKNEVYRQGERIRVSLEPFLSPTAENAVRKISSALADH